MVGKKRLILGLLLVSFASLWLWTSHRFNPGKPVQTGFSQEPAPDFELFDLEGNLVTLSEKRGKLVLVVFWASWCGPCRQEMPSLNRLFQTLGGGEFTVLGVNIENRSAPVRRFAADHGLAFPILLDTENKVQERYAVYNIPQAFLIDKEGRLVNRYMGYVDWMAAENLNKLRSLMGKP